MYAHKNSDLARDQSYVPKFSCEATLTQPTRPGYKANATVSYRPVLPVVAASRWHVSAEQRRSGRSHPFSRCIWMMDIAVQKATFVMQAIPSLNNVDQEGHILSVGAFG
jgi:hypothetical protein